MNYGSNLSSSKRQGKLEREVESATPIETYLEDLFEKRSTAREYGLKGLLSCLKEEFSSSHEFLKTNSKSFYDAIQKILTKGSTHEQILACQLLNIACITDCDQQQFSLFKSILEPLVKDVKINPDRWEMHLEAVKSLAITCFLLNTDSTNIISIMKLFEEIFLNSSYDAKLNPLLIETTIKSWGLLLTSLSDDEIQSIIMVENFSNIADLLNEFDNVDCKVAVGDVLILLIDSLQNFTNSEDETYDPFSLQEFIDFRDFLSTIDHLSQFNRSLSKKEKQKQKNTFKELLQVVKGHSVDEETLNFRGTNLTFDTATDLFRLNFFRQILSEGFQPHMQENPLLAHIFNFTIPTTFVRKFQSKLEKKFNERLRSQKDKMRSKEKRSNLND